MELRPITLNWQAVHPISDIPHFDTISNGPGVYTWGFNLEDEREQRLNSITEPPAEYLRSLDWRFIPYYVGKASRLGDRLRAHSCHLRDGWKGSTRYTYYHRDALHNFSRERVSSPVASVDLDNWRIFAASKATIDQYSVPVEQERLQPHINFMWQRIWFSYAELEDPADRRPVESLLHRKLEGYKAHEQRPGTYSGIEVIHTGEPLVCKSFDTLMKLSSAEYDREPQWR